MQQTSSRRRPSRQGPATKPNSSRRAEQPRQPIRKPRRDPLWARLVIVLGALLMMASGGAIVGGKVLIGQVSGGIQQQDLLGSAGEEYASIDGPVNILLVGVDERPDSTEPIRADAIIIAHLSANRELVALAHVPRDAETYIPAYKKTGWNGGTDKINAAFAFGSQNGGGREGGFELLALTLKKMTGGIKFNGGAIVDFGGFQSLVNALGGVDMCIDTRVVSQHIGTDSKGKFRSPSQGGKAVVYEPGCRRLEPWQALDYVRQRKGLPNGDYDRARHQQQFVKAMVKEAKKQGVATNPVKLRKMMEAAGKALTIDRQAMSLEAWLFTLRGAINNDLVMIKTNGGKITPTQNGSAEQLSDESRLLFTALRDGRLAEFIAAHPHFVSADGSPV